MSLHAIVTAHANGFDENMYLDSATRTKVEETGGANFIFVTKDNKIVTPHSDTILPSITRRSIMYVAEHYLGLEVEEAKFLILYLQATFDKLSQYDHLSLYRLKMLAHIKDEY